MNLSYFENKYPHVIKSIRTAKSNNRLAHAYLIYADDTALGKELSSVMAKLIACEKNTEGVGLLRADLPRADLPCGKCRSCLALERNSYTDLYKLEPLSKSRRILIGDNDREPNTMRWFQSRFYYSSLSSSGSKKLGIIYEADRILIQAQNAFLKTLEEPPANSHFILCTDNPKALLPTVLSRCHKISLLTNKVSYEFKHAKDLFDSLRRIVSSEKNISNAGKEIEILCGIFTDIKNEAEKEIAAEFDEKARRSGESASDIKKYLTPAKDAAVSAGYMLRREELINAIVTWFSQLYQLSLGISHSNLPNGEIIDEKIIAEANVDDLKVLAYLEYAERLSWVLKFNIDDTLAVHEFVMNSFFKT
ncbi:MAG TPA: hypothetical protein DD381_07185 [Lentisphaeria bacterium]|nr:MAG: hypothetical protein A2X47_05750 [Lentisphaerae bacterium GWF2_38_69]HBM16105.1 hypothetical protein [Lentisphaeria bacterium]